MTSETADIGLSLSVGCEGAHVRHIREPMSSGRTFFFFSYAGRALQESSPI